MSDIIAMHKADLVDAVTKAVKPLKIRIAALEAHIAATPHGDNCYLTDEYPGNVCRCGKEAALSGARTAQRPPHLRGPIIQAYADTNGVPPEPSAAGTADEGEKHGTP